MTIKTITVSNATQLAAAIKIATGGETINLNSANYGALSLYKFAPTSTVTIQSAAGQHAVFSGITLNTATNVNFNNFEVTMKAGTGAASLTSMITVGISSNIRFNALDIHGSIDGNNRNDANGMRVTSSHDVTVTNSQFHDLYAAAAFENNSAIVVAGNTVHNVREGLDFGNVHDVLVDHNMIYDVIANYVQDKSISPINGDHPDSIQFWTSVGGASSDVTISNNAMFVGQGKDVHGIFVTTQNETFNTNFVITNNLVSVDNINGITVGGMHGGEITNNTVLTSAGSANLAAVRVIDSTGIKSANNISSYFGVDNSSVASTGNVKVHAGGAMDATNVAKFVKNAMAVGTISVDDFANIAHTTTGFAVAAFKAPVALASYDTLAHALDAGTVLHHIA